MKKIGRMNEIAWIIGIVGCALGVSLCTKANFGLSMIAAPPYIFHVAFRVRMPWLTQGTAEYIWQGILLLFMCIVTGRFHWKYLLSFGTVFFRFGEKYNAVFFTSDPVFLFVLRLSFNHGQGMTGMLEGGTERCT